MNRLRLTKLIFLLDNSNKNKKNNLYVNLYLFILFNIDTLMCKQSVSVRVTSLKAVESLIMVQPCYHLSGNLHWLVSGVSGMSTTLPFPRTVSNLAIFRRTLATLRSQAVLDSGRALIAAKIHN